MSARTPPTAVVPSLRGAVAATRATVRSLHLVGPAPCLVVDVDGGYRPVADERVLDMAEVASSLGLSSEATASAATLEERELSFYAGVLGAKVALDAGAGRAVVVGAGVRVLGDLGEFAGESTDAVVVPGVDGPGVVRRGAAAADRLRRDPRTGQVFQDSPGPGPLHSRAVCALSRDEDIELLRALAAGWRTAPAALDAFAAAVGATTADPALVVSAWRSVGECRRDERGRLRVGDRPVVAVDLSAFDPRRPWLLDAEATTSPRVLLSSHPALAELAAEEAARRLADGAEEVATSVGMDAVLRAEARRAQHAAGELPDVLGLGLGPDPESWALGLVPEGATAPLARYLAAVRAVRADLEQAFPAVPGTDTARLARWALRSGVGETGLNPGLLERAARLTLAAQRRGRQSGSVRNSERHRGVNLVGYLAGELGLGESARLVDAALQSAGVETSTFDVSRDLESRRDAAFRASEPVLRATSLICVNGAETPAVAAQLHAVLEGTRRIGMWYWELEDFPAGHAVGFAHVDEVWAATDFMRAAMAKHAGDVPVRTVTPPLPQAGPDRGRVPERFGIPTDRPWFLFTFDFLSRAPRKNPSGLVEAFTRAFGERPLEERPALVLKTINADRCPEDAERLRLQIAGRSDVLLVEDYLDNDQRHVLAANCTAFVSLHRAEGLGLTIAEAMAWGKPVIATGYGGVTQFCDEENSFLVRWRRGYVEETSGPYDKGLAWAEPDLDHAAEQMRLVIDDPARAAAVGERAARDIREKHGVEAAGSRMRQILEEGYAPRLAHVADQADPSGAGVGRSGQADDEEKVSSAMLGRARRLARAARRTLRRRGDTSSPSRPDS